MMVCLQMVPVSVKKDRSQLKTRTKKHPKKRQFLYIQVGQISVCLSIYLSFCLSVYLSVCLSVRIHSYHCILWVSLFHSHPLTVAMVGVGPHEFPQRWLLCGGH